MASAADQTFISAVISAETARQFAKGSAYATYQAAGFTPAARTTYVAAALAADVAYSTAVNSARNTAGIGGGTVGDFQPLGGLIGTVST